MNGSQKMNPDYFGDSLKFPIQLNAAVQLRCWAETFLEFGLSVDLLHHSFFFFFIYVS